MKLIDGFDSNYRYILVAARRARQLQGGAPPVIDTQSRKPCRIAQDEIKAGKVTFVVTNTSKTEQEHEFLVVKTNLTADKLPMTQGGARVDEDKLGHIDEVGDIEPGKTKKGTFTLTAGKYLLFCNEEGHMNAGMVTSFVVEP